MFDRLWLPSRSSRISPLCGMDPHPWARNNLKEQQKYEGYIRVCHSGDNNILLHLPALLKPSADIAKIRAITTLSTTKMYFILFFFVDFCFEFKLNCSLGRFTLV